MSRRVLGNFIKLHKKICKNEKIIANYKLKYEQKRDFLNNENKEMYKLLEKDSKKFQLYKTRIKYWVDAPYGTTSGREHGFHHYEYIYLSHEDAKKRLDHEVQLVEADPQIGSLDRRSSTKEIVTMTKGDNSWVELRDALENHQYIPRITKPKNLAKP